MVEGEAAGAALAEVDVLGPAAIGDPGMGERGRAAAGDLDPAPVAGPGCRGIAVAVGIAAGAVVAGVGEDHRGRLGALGDEGAEHIDGVGVVGLDHGAGCDAQGRAGIHRHARGEVHGVGAAEVPGGVGGDGAAGDGHRMGVAREGAAVGDEVRGHADADGHAVCVVLEGAVDGRERASVGVDVEPGGGVAEQHVIQAEAAGAALAEVDVLGPAAVGDPGMGERGRAAAGDLDPAPVAGPGCRGIAVAVGIAAGAVVAGVGEDHRGRLGALGDEGAEHIDGVGVVGLDHGAGCDAQGRAGIHRHARGEVHGVGAAEVPGGVGGDGAAGDGHRMGVAREGAAVGDEVRGHADADGHAVCVVLEGAVDGRERARVGVDVEPGGGVAEQHVIQAEAAGAALAEVDVLGPAAVPDVRVLDHGRAGISDLYAPPVAWALGGTGDHHPLGRCPEYLELAVDVECVRHNRTRPGFPAPMVSTAPGMTVMLTTTR